MCKRYTNIKFINMMNVLFKKKIFDRRQILKEIFFNHGHQ